MLSGFHRAALRCVPALLAAATAFADPVAPPAQSSAQAEAPATGPATEKRFPPLTIPAGFKATLFACDPLVEYPSVIALGPTPGSLLVAHDYVTGLGYDIIRRDEVRLLEDTDGDGYADASTLVADGFHSIQGLALYEGSIYVMHAPLLTRLRDANGDGRIEGGERRDLLKGLGLTPEDNKTRLHCANGVVGGHDGWLYLAMGDNGVNVPRPEGDRLVLNGGGILRCRPDGRDLHVFSTGLRNIYDIALDDELNAFVRDNENDGGDYMIRVAQSFPGADHGYPYHYYERPDEALRPLADLGRGSSAGVVCYLETAFPPEYRGNLFCCEWGRAVVRYERKRAGSSFAPTQELDFAAGAENDPYGFKPTDLVVDRDGSLLVSDWGDGQRPKRGRGRIYRIAWVGAEAHAAVAEAPGEPVKFDKAALIRQLDDPSGHLRAEAVQRLSTRADTDPIREALTERTIGPSGRRHAVWALTRAVGAAAAPTLYRLIETDPEPSVRAQAVRALADLSDPLFDPPTATVRGIDGAGPRRQRLVAADVCQRLATLSVKQDPQVTLEVVVAFGRLHWTGAPGWLRDNLSDPDAALAHAAQQTLSRCDNIPAVLAMIDQPDDRPIRLIALRSLADRHETAIVDGVIARLRDDDPARLPLYADLLARAYRKPATWTYWGYRPPPRPANTVEWERTEEIERALNSLLRDDNHAVRASALKRMQREQVPVATELLAAWLAEERTSGRVGLLLDSLAKLPAAESRPLLARMLPERDHGRENRQRALAMMVAALDPQSEPALLKLADLLEEGPVLAQLLAAAGSRPGIDVGPLALKKLDSPDAAVREAALRACVERKVTAAAGRIPAFLRDREAGVRQVACAAAAAFESQAAAGTLLELARDPNADVRAASLSALSQLGQPGAVDAALAGLEHPATQIAALDYLGRHGKAEHRPAIAALGSTSRSIDVLTQVFRTLALIRQQLTDKDELKETETQLAAIQGQTGLLLDWRVGTQMPPDVAGMSTGDPKSVLVAGNPQIADGVDSRVRWTPGSEAATPAAESRIVLGEPVRAQFLGSSAGTLEVVINDRLVYRRDKPGQFQADSDRFETDLAKGLNRIVVRTVPVKGTAEFHLRFRPLSSSAEHERLTQYALANSGNADRGRELFLNAEKSLCMKCHRIGEQGGAIGPNLTGVGSRFSRIHLIESILEPSRTIAPSYDTQAVAMQSGQVIVGVKVAEDDATLTLGDETGKRHELRKADIEERTSQRQSTMPKGIEKRLSDKELLDLLTFLLAQKKP